MPVPEPVVTPCVESELHLSSSLLRLRDVAVHVRHFQECFAFVDNRMAEVHSLSTLNEYTMVLCMLSKLGQSAVQQMAAVCKPGGQLLLLQHGKASWSWLNHKLDDEAPAHFAKWGCWWNRDILQLVHEVLIVYLINGGV